MSGKQNQIIRLMANAGAKVHYLNIVEVHEPASLWMRNGVCGLRGGIKTSSCPVLLTCREGDCSLPAQLRCHSI